MMETHELAMKPGVEALRALPLIGGADLILLARLNEVADLARVGPDEDLLREGDVLEELNFLLAGQAAATHTQPSGIVALLDVMLPVRPLCLPAALQRLPAPIGVRTLTSARLIVLPVAELRAMIRDSPDLAPPFLDYALNEMHRLTQEICALKLQSSAQRLASYLLGLVQETELSPARFILPFEKRLLAARVGCSQENLSRAFATLRRIGVETQRGVVVVRDFQSLRAFSEGIRT